MLTLALKTPPAQRIDMSPLTPDGLAGRSLAEVAAIELSVGNRRARLEALFDVSGEPIPLLGERLLVVANGTDRLDRVGQGLSGGRIEVRGDVGAYVGLGMSGGRIDVEGGAGPFAGCDMSGGELRIGGDAGDFLGAALPGERTGMSGGAVVVTGDAGDRVGDRMRRGLILIGGDAGAYCGSRMTAGTILALGTAGEFAGFAMRRGTILLGRAPARVPATFNDCGSHGLQILRVLIEHVRGFGGPFAGLARTNDRVRRLAGDRAVGGQGEILIREA